MADSGNKIVGSSAAGGMFSLKMIHEAARGVIA